MRSQSSSGQALPPLWRAFLLLVGLMVAGTSAQYPNYNTNPLPANSSGMGSTAAQLAANMRIGLNIGNTLEATGGETSWGNPLITQAFVDFAKASGFNAIRLPVSWNTHADATTAKIDPTWLARVKEVVNYCVRDNLFVIVNIHWDGGWLENNVTPDKQTANNAKQKAFWQQIATTLRDFDEHVLFASANEPNVETAEQMAVLMTYHQTFVDAVRATGGRNAYRKLVIQGPSTDIEKTNKLMTSWVTDTVANRVLAEIHYYTPWQFTGMTEDASWGNQFFYWGKPNHSPTDTAHNPTWGEEDTVDTFFGYMKTKFVDKGIPVVIGEFGSSDRKDTLTGDALKLHEASRAYFVKYVVQRGRALGLIPFYWDTGSLLDRANYKVLDQLSMTGLMEGAGGTTTPAPTTTVKPTATPTPTTTTTPTPTTTVKPTVTPTPTTTTTPNGAAQWGQCGGLNWTGPKTCVSPWTCTKVNDWYSQCV